MTIDGEQIRRTTLEVVAEIAKQRDGSISSTAVLNEAARRLGIQHDQQLGQALLTFWYDLFRTGYMSWGLNLSNPDPPWCHLTDQGRVALANISRDPSNPDGYLRYLTSRANLTPVCQSYVQEALATFNAQCVKAAAVMIGAAAESMVLALRDALVARLQTLNQARPADLEDWRIKRVLDAIDGLLRSKQPLIPRPLFESFESYWPAFTQQIRVARNEAGHPTSIDPVTPETVHASLLIFPELAKLTTELVTWVTSGMR